MQDRLTIVSPHLRSHQSLWFRGLSVAKTVWLDIKENGPEWRWVCPAISRVKNTIIKNYLNSILLSATGQRLWIIPFLNQKWCLRLTHDWLMFNKDYCKSESKGLNGAFCPFDCFLNWIIPSSSSGMLDSPSIRITRIMKQQSETQLLMSSYIFPTLKCQLHLTISY